MRFFLAKNSHWKIVQSFLQIPLHGAKGAKPFWFTTYLTSLNDSQCSDFTKPNNVATCEHGKFPNEHSQSQEVNCIGEKFFAKKSKSLSQKNDSSSG